MQGSYRIGNAQTIGSREVQSNYFSVWEKDGFVFAVLADGTRDNSLGRRAATLCVEVSVEEFMKRQEMEEIPAFYERLQGRLLWVLQKEFGAGGQPGVSFSSICLKRETLWYYTVGENTVFIFDGKDFSPLRKRQGVVTGKGTFMAGLCSKGVSEALSEVELLDFLGRSGSPHETARQMVEAVNEKHVKMAANATIVLVEGGI